MCKATPLQHNGADMVPENILQYKAGGHLAFKDRHTMHQLALDLGYPFFLHSGKVYAAQDSSVLADETDVFQAALPACKGKSALAVKSIPIALAA